MVRKTSDRLRAKSIAVTAMLESSLPAIMLGWLCAAMVLSAGRILLSVKGGTTAQEILLTAFPYIFVCIAPVVGWYLATRSFPSGVIYEQPRIRLSRIGKWSSVDCLTARSNPNFGSTGFMASLLVGILLNVPVRTIEYITAVPAIPPAAPEWAHAIMFAMTTDLVVMNFIYMVVFVAALRNVPWFPRLLVLAWTFDILSQVSIAQHVAAQSQLPGTVGEAMGALLSGNVKKVAISIAIWLPYLLLSERVNVTYRSRVSA